MIHKSKTPESERDSAQTPDNVFQFANLEFGPFDIDLAADKHNAKCPRFFTKEMNALDQSWSDQKAYEGWCNPPYSDITPWIFKAYDEAAKGFNTTMLIPTFNGEKWGETVYDLATEVCLIFPRVNFIRPDGSIMTGNPRGSMLVWFSFCGSSWDLKVTKTNMRTWK